MIVKVRNHLFGIAIFVNSNNMNLFDSEFIPLFYKTLPVNLSLFGFILAFILYNFRSKILFRVKTSLVGKKIHNFLNRKWFFDKLYNEYFGQFFFKFGYSVSYKFVDRGIFEIFGPTGLLTTALKIGTNLHKLQSGNIYHYTLGILIGIIVLFGVRQLVLLFGFLVDYRIILLIFVLSFFIINN